MKETGKSLIGNVELREILKIIKELMNALDDSNYKMEDLVIFVRYLNKKIENLRAKKVKKSRILTWYNIKKF